MVFRLPYFITVGDGSGPWGDHSGHRGTGPVLSLGSPVQTVPSGCVFSKGVLSLKVFPVTYFMHTVWLRVLQFLWF